MFGVFSILPSTAALFYLRILGYFKVAAVSIQSVVSNTEFRKINILFFFRFSYCKMNGLESFLNRCINVQKFDFSGHHLVFGIFQVNLSTCAYL